MFAPVWDRARLVAGREAVDLQPWVARAVPVVVVHTQDPLGDCVAQPREVEGDHTTDAVSLPHHIA